MTVSVSFRNIRPAESISGVTNLSVSCGNGTRHHQFAILLSIAAALLFELPRSLDRGHGSQNRSRRRLCRRQRLCRVLRALRGIIDTELTQGGGRGGLTLGYFLKSPKGTIAWRPPFGELTATAIFLRRSRHSRHSQFGTVADPGDRAAIFLKMRKNAKKPCGIYTFCADPSAKIRLFLKVPSRNAVKITVSVQNAMKCDKCYTLQ